MAGREAMAVRSLRALALALLATAVLALSAAGSAAKGDPFVGTWTSVDTRDSSNQRMVVARRASGGYTVDLTDDLAAVCGSGSVTGKGTGTVSGTTLSGLIALTCASGQVFADVPFRLTYRKASDTLIDGLGVVWSRVKPPAAKPEPAALPLGRLVLTAGEAPGLKPRAIKPRLAKRALADALRPARLPGFAPKQSQAARFGKGTTQITSLAFVMATPAAAKAAAKAIGRAGRGTRIALGEGGWTLRRRATAVVWHRGRVVGAIVLELAQKPAVRSTVAGHYGRVADARVERALTRTALDGVVAGVSRKGQLSRKAAFDLFALTFGPLPGTKRPPGPVGEGADATTAARNILRLWKTLTPAQRTAAARLIGINGVVLPGTRWTASRGRGADFGDPNFSPDASMTELAKQFAAAYLQKLKSKTFQFSLEIVAGPGSPVPGAAAYALPLDDQGNYTKAPTICRVTMAPPGLAEDATGQARIIAHEVFHCMQFAMVGATSWVAGKFGDWVGQGTADWVAFKVTGVPWAYAYSFQEYLNTCDSRSLYSRVDNSAVGFFGHTDDFAEDFWGRIEGTVVAGFKYGSPVAYDAARGNEAVFLDTWASSALIAPSYGLAWTSASPVKPPAGAGCPTHSIVGDAEVKSDPLTVRLYYIENVVNVNRPLMHVQIAKGHARISDGQFVEQTVKDDWFLTGPEEPVCPPGTEGTPPPAPTLSRPALLGLTGGKGPGSGAISYHSLEEFCKQKQPPPPVDCVKDAHGAATGHGPCGPGQEPVPAPAPGQPGSTGKGDEPPDPVGCTGHGCAQSAADPHLLPFGGAWYDFQGVGEYTLVRSANGELEVQVRQEPWPGSKVVSMNTAAAMRVAGDRVAVYKGWPLSVRVNRQPVLLKAKGLRLPKGGILRPLPQGALDVVWPDGTVVRVTAPTRTSIDLTISIAPKWLGKVIGLLGDNDGNTADDFRTRGGKVLDAKVVQGKDRRAYRLRYRVFGDSWRVTPQASLFDYAPGQSTRSFTNRGFPAFIATTDRLSPAVRRKAEQACRRMGLAQKAVLEACILDVAQTGSYGFSTALALAQLSAKKGKAKPPPPPPATKGLRATVTFRGATFTIKGSKADEGCRSDFPGTGFRIFIGTYGADGRPVFVLAAPRPGGTRDGTYPAAGVIEVPFGAQRLEALVQGKVTLAAGRTRGTFTGTASTPGNDPISVSFSC